LLTDKIQLSRIRVNVIVGILPPERLLPQPVDMSIDLSLDLEEAGHKGDLSKSIDYSELLKQVSFIMHAGRFELLETAALAIVHYLLTPTANGAKVERARVSLCKRNAPRVSPALPKVTITRAREQVKTTEEKLGEVTVQQIFASKSVVIQRFTGRSAAYPTAEIHPKFKSEDLDLGNGSLLRVRGTAG